MLLAQSIKNAFIYIDEIRQKAEALESTQQPIAQITMDQLPKEADKMVYTTKDGDRNRVGFRNRNTGRGGKS